MNKLLLLTIWLVPARQVWAQDTLHIAQALQGIMNPQGLQLSTRTVLYRQLRDTLTSRPAKRLRPGDAVIIHQGAYPGWIKVVRGTRNLINFSSDTATYYMPKSGAIGAKSFILI
jgi:hypothetical protein